VTAQSRAVCTSRDSTKSTEAAATVRQPIAEGDHTSVQIKAAFDLNVILSTYFL
jgi:hypothetical protein